MTRLCTPCGKRDGRVVVHREKPAPGLCARCQLIRPDLRAADCYEEERGK